MEEINKKDWSEQNLYVGIDLHKKQWVATVRTRELHLKTFVSPPQVEVLVSTLKRFYPGARIRAVYEAGCFGYHVVDFLNAREIETIIVTPSSIPIERDQMFRQLSFNSQTMVNHS